MPFRYLLFIRQVVCDRALTGRPIQLKLDFRFGNGKPKRTIINHHANPTAVGFAKGADAEDVTVNAAHVRIEWEKFIR
jgi:hypothetical protein